MLLIVSVLSVAYLDRDAYAAPLLQATPFPTPTPGPDGRILYIVKDGDTLWTIAAISNLSVEEIRNLNNMSDDIVTVGQVLLLGLAGPAQPVQPPVQQLPTATSAPTATPGISTGTLCILLFNDINGDALRQEEEFSIAGGAISISSRDGKTSLTAETTSDLDEDGIPIPVCFTDLSTGDYNITMAAPEDYNPTTLTNYALSLGGGDETYLDFGAQINSQTVANTPVADSNGNGNTGLIFGVLGLLLVVGGIGLGIYASRLRQ